MLRLLIALALVLYVNGLTCPPSCEPPSTESGCKAYTKNAACSQDVKDISSSEAHCGCLWQSYIQTVEPDAKVIFSDEGAQCYAWSTKLCAILEKREKSLLKKGYSPRQNPELDVFRNSQDLGDILKRMEKLESVQITGGHRSEKAKHRRRNGVGTITKELENILNKEKHDNLRRQTGTETSIPKKIDRELKEAGAHISKLHLKKLTSKDEKYIGKSMQKKHDNLRRQTGTVTSIPKKIDRELKEAGEKVKDARADISKLHLKNLTTKDEKYIGKPMQSDTSWIEVVPQRAKGSKIKTRTPGPPNVNSGKDKDIITVRRHWIDLDMPVEQFKLGVFMIILLLNILVVLVLIFCRKSGKEKKHTETKPAGDLTTDNVFYPDSPDGRLGPRNKQRTRSPFSNIVDLVREKMHRRDRNKSAMKPLLQMEEVNPNAFISNANSYSKVRGNSPFVGAGMYQSPRKVSHGLYENIYEEPEVSLDNTYEEPLPMRSNLHETRQYYKRKYSLRSDSFSEDGSSPTKYVPRNAEASNKTLSFALSPRTYLTLQDRVDAGEHESQET